LKIFLKRGGGIVFSQKFFSRKTLVQSHPNSLIYELPDLKKSRKFSPQFLNLHMQLFRNLAHNVFFKIILAFVALSFVLFGISGFLLGSPNSWVVKIGDTTVGQNAFNRALQSDREIILASNKSPEALKYLESEQFKSAVLGRIVNRAMIEKLQGDFGVEASKKLIMQEIAKDSSFKNKEGKFDRETFKAFLSKNGFNEERYINEIANEVTAAMVLQSIPMVAPINLEQVVEMENFKQEKRLADVLTISAKNVGAPAKPTDEELTKFFSENRQNYSAPELRKVSYLQFSKSDFAKDLAITDAEIQAEYEKNKQNYMQPESRVFYHVVFEEESKATEFSAKLNESDKSKINDEFAKLAKEFLKKDPKEIKLTITEKDLIPELASAFKLAKNNFSAVLKSPLGFHIFLLTDIKESKPMSFAELKGSIKEQLLRDRDEKVLQSKITEIDDQILSSNSLEEVAKKFNLKFSSAITINQAGKNEKGEEISAVKNLENFAQNAFAAKQGQASKIFYAIKSSGFYALKVEEIEVAHDQKLEEVKSQVIADLNKKNAGLALEKLAQKIGEEVKSNPNSLAEIAKKYQLKLEKNREFPRVLYANFQGRQVPYKNKFIEDLFAVKKGEATSVQQSGQEFTIGVVREIKKSSLASAQSASLQKQAEEDFKAELMQEFNNYLLAKNPVKVNDKILSQNAAQ
jgi:peptidyl-prolyl cis-trans isomerase D